jgi:pantetheine-phosphate adenylyltransferase
MHSAIYAGSFDPITFGHLDIIRRGTQLFDHLIVAIAVNIDKTPLFSLEDRLAMIRENVQKLPNVEVTPFEGMAVHFASQQECRTLLRGIRTVADFEYEFQMALTNRVLAPQIETVFVMASQEYSFLSSRLIKETASLGGDVRAFVPEPVARRLLEKLRR